MKNILEMINYEGHISKEKIDTYFVTNAVANNCNSLISDFITSVKFET